MSSLAAWLACTGTARSLLTRAPQLGQKTAGLRVLSENSLPQL